VKNNLFSSIVIFSDGYFLKLKAAAVIAFHFFIFVLFFHC